MACGLLNTETCLDYLSIIQRNLYRMRIDPNQRAMLKKYLALVDNELDENSGVPLPPTPAEAYPRR